MKALLSLIAVVGLAATSLACAQCHAPALGAPDMSVLRMTTMHRHAHDPCIMMCGSGCGACCHGGDMDMKEMKKDK